MGQSDDFNLTAMILIQRCITGEDRVFQRLMRGENGGKRETLRRLDAIDLRALDDAQVRRRPIQPNKSVRSWYARCEPLRPHARKTLNHPVHVAGHQSGSRCVVDEHVIRRFFTAEVLQPAIDRFLPFTSTQHNVENLVGFKRFHDVSNGIHRVF